MKRFISYIMLFSAIAVTMAEESPIATLKVEYDQWSANHGKKPGESDTYGSAYILQVGKGTSYYFEAHTFFMDSLENDPNGKAMLALEWDSAYKEMMSGGRNSYDIMRDKGLTGGVAPKYLKNFTDGKIKAWDRNSGDHYVYEVDMADLDWEICDSTANVIGYECNLAKADYHGRKWIAWFAPEIPVQDGPWQLCGLPGLILKAETEDGEYGFDATGIQQCNEPFKPLYVKEDKLFKTNRKAFLKMKDYTRRNRASQIKAMTGGALTLSDKVNYKGTKDFKETDYHE